MGVKLGLRNEELYDLYFSSGEEMKYNEMGRACGTCGGEERCVQGSGVETRGKETLGKPRLRWEDNSKMNLQEVGLGHDLAQDRTDGGHL
jgi:hypothetical protein